MYADVIIDISHEQLDKTFQYAVPDELVDVIELGMSVDIPFGAGNRQITGYVVGLGDKAAYPVEKIKYITGITEGKVTAVSRMLKLAAWLKHNYGCTMNQAIKTVIPVKDKVKQKEKHSVNLIIDAAQAQKYLDTFAKKNAKARYRLLEALIKEPVIDESIIKSKLNITVYLETIEHVLNHGRQAIVLIPEIALTFQTVQRFYHRFGDKVSIMNSRMSKGERYDQFLRAQRGDISVMIGPRSALFTPFSNIGLIVIDEEHEGAYKSETVPRYHAREVACHIAKEAGASVILGSATPSMESYYAAMNGHIQLITLDSRAGSGGLPAVDIVDLREELRLGNRTIFSNRLRELMSDRLAKHEQIMLFLNKRGVAGFISCRSCGKVMKCPHCDVSLTEHADGRLMCHYCGYTTPKITVCPSCGSRYVSGFRAGTEGVEAQVKKTFPQARVLRMDMDTTRGKDGHEKILSEFANGNADILIGTQMIVKGHDFPNVTLMGVLAADMSLYSSDYRASERTFQLLTQAAGRAGRAEKSGNVVIQTYTPEHFSIVSAANQDYNAFYEQEIAYRKLCGYPPADNLMKIMLSSPDEMLLTKSAAWVKAFVDNNCKYKGLMCIGPADAPIYKIKDVYSKIIYVKHKDREVLNSIHEKLDVNIVGNQAFKNINVQYDING